MPEERYSFINSGEIDQTFSSVKVFSSPNNRFHGEKLFTYIPPPRIIILVQIKNLEKPNKNIKIY